MNKQEFQALLQDHPIFLDGATGSNLQKRGMPVGVCPEKWILENREVLIELQREFVKAGSNILYAPTFTANRIKLKEYGLDDQIRQMNHDLVAISKEAVGNQAYEGDTYDEAVAGAAREYYDRANIRIQYIITILHGEIPEGEGVTYTEENSILGGGYLYQTEEENDEEVPEDNFDTDDTVFYEEPAEDATQNIEEQ